MCWEDGDHVAFIYRMVCTLEVSHNKRVSSHVYNKVCFAMNITLEAKFWYSFKSYILGCVLQHCASHLLSYISLTGS